jgi:hypothetical protein
MWPAHFSKGEKSRLLPPPFVAPEILSFLIIAGVWKIILKP